MWKRKEAGARGRPAETGWDRERERSGDRGQPTGNGRYGERYRGEYRERAGPSERPAVTVRHRETVQKKSGIPDIRRTVKIRELWKIWKLWRLFKPTKRKLKWSIATVVLMIGAFYLLNRIFFITFLEGDSMLPSLEHGDLIVGKVHWGEPVQGNIVIVEADGLEDGVQLVKRVLGVPGDTLTWTADGRTMTLGADEYWLNSDANRYVSHEYTYDSRDFGPVSRDQIKAIVFWKSGMFQWAEEDREPWQDMRDEDGWVRPAR